jgi:hypothetical protein
MGGPYCYHTYFLQQWLDMVATMTGQSARVLDSTFQFHARSGALFRNMSTVVIEGIGYPQCELRRREDRGEPSIKDEQTRYCRNRREGDNGGAANEMLYGFAHCSTKVGEADMLVCDGTLELSSWLVSDGHGKPLVSATTRQLIDMMERGILVVARYPLNEQFCPRVIREIAHT